MAFLESEIILLDWISQQGIYRLANIIILDGKMGLMFDNLCMPCPCDVRMFLHHQLILSSNISRNSSFKFQITVRIGGSENVVSALDHLYVITSPLLYNSES